MNAGMNCTAWNSVRANALEEEAERHAEDCVPDGEATTSSRRVHDREAEEDEADERDGRRLHRRDRREGDRNPAGCRASREAS